MDSDTHSVLHHLDVVETGRRRRWSAGEKERIVLESMAGPRRISATARRHGIARSQLLAWRRALLADQSLLAGRAVLAGSGAPSPGFVPVVVPPPTLPPATAVPGRVEIVLRSGRRLIVEGGVDIDAVLKLARGLEASR